MVEKVKQEERILVNANKLRDFGTKVLMKLDVLEEDARMAIDVLRHEVQQELAILPTQEFQHRLRPNVPASWIDEREGETVVAGNLDVV